MSWRKSFAATFREPNNRDKLPPLVIRGIPTVRRLNLPFFCGCSGGSFKIWAVAFSTNRNRWIVHRVASLPSTMRLGYLFISVLT